jgi:MFS family permease
MVEKEKRWWALYVLCAGELMIVLDTTVVNVALPSIRESLGFSEASLVWVVNAYMLTYGGFLLLGGRLGDYFGHRRLFLSGIGRCWIEPGSRGGQSDFRGWRRAGRGWHFFLSGIGRCWIEPGTCRRQSDFRGWRRARRGRRLFLSGIGRSWPERGSA